MLLRGNVILVRRIKPLVLLVLLGTLWALPAMAQEADAISRALLDEGYYVESSYSIAGLDTAMDTAGADAPFLVALDQNISDPSALADELVARIGFGTVIVLTPDSIGGASFDFDANEVDGRLDQVVEALGADDDLAAAVEAFAGGPGGISGGMVLVGLGIVGVGGLAVASVRRRRRLESAAQSRLAEARTELSRQVDLVANDIVDLNSRVELAENATATEFYRTASATYALVEEAVPKAGSLDELERLSDQLDEARWELDAAEATLNGDVTPERPTDRAMACFFDPTHRAGIEDVEIETAAGRQKVGVCRDCARRLRSEDPPKPGSITVNGQAVPAPQAPRHSGGGGFDWMDIFSVVVDGSRIPYSVGGGRNRLPSRSGGGLLGGVARTSRSSTSPKATRRSPGKTISRGRSRRR